MKNKHTGLVGLALVVLALVATGAQVLWASWYQVRPLSLGSAFDLYSSERLSVDVAAVNRMDLVEPTLPNLVKPESVPSSGAIGVDSDIKYAMLGQRAHVAPPIQKMDPPVEPIEPESTPYQVGMTYISGDHRYAVVDRKFYRQGELLPYGESLAEISDSAVRIESAAGSRWIAIQRANN